MDRYRDAALRFIEELEVGSAKRGEGIEQFHRGLSEVVDELRERLSAAHDELPKDVAAEITRLR